MDTPDSAITISDAAASKLNELLAGQEDADQALRVAVRGGGCSGFQYALALDSRKDDDHVFEHNGVSVVVDKTSMQFVFGSEVDYVEGLQGAGFQVNNPNVVAACGCGSSFQVRD
jgi:iron-sulfur cluster assembly accessory protein